MTILVTYSKKDLPEQFKGSWPKIAQCLPNRTVQSCHNFCRRKFNPANYHGKWTPVEEEALLNLVAKHGKRWKIIAEELAFENDNQVGRTAENVKDKYKQLGGDKSQNRSSESWTLQELVQLL